MQVDRAQTLVNQLEEELARKDRSIEVLIREIKERDKELKSLLEYAKGTSLKKEIPLTAHAEEEMGYFICPSCDMAVGYTNTKEEHKYCLNCGQKIKWD